MNAQHTPGPWVHHPEDNIITAENRPHATLIEWQARSLHVSTSERDANARLIAAAPDLLAALEKVWSEGVIPDGFAILQDQVCDAIAKAKEPSGEKS